MSAIFVYLGFIIMWAINAYICWEIVHSKPLVVMCVSLLITDVWFLMMEFIIRGML